MTRTTAKAVLVLDGWEAYEPLIDEDHHALRRLLTEGPPRGLHTLVSAYRWANISPPIRDLFGNRLELEPGEPSGRGRTPDGRHFRAALPRIDGRATTDDLPAGIDHLVRTVRARYEDG